MTWRHLPGNRVRFTLIADAPAWMSIGIHRPGGRGMPGADMIVATPRQRQVCGGLWFEAWTSAYDRPPREGAPYGHATSGLGPERVCRRGKRRTCRRDLPTATRASTRKRTRPAPSVERRAVSPLSWWARGDPGVVAADYHGARRGTASTVTCRIPVRHCLRRDGRDEETIGGVEASRALEKAATDWGGDRAERHRRDTRTTGRPRGGS